MSEQLSIYNTMSRQVEPFETIEPGKVRMYVCGVTVYDHAHIGHGMSSIAFDAIRRYLQYAGYEVTYAQNFTDIDDKIINRAAELGIDPNELTQSMIDTWDDEMSAFNILKATINPRATQEIPQIIAMIQGLIDNGHAYAANGDVYYKVRSFDEYGKLSHRDIQDLLSGARIAVGEHKDDPLDFALWKAAKPGEPTWASPWSDGRPGWHIECSAMCAHHLGEQIDIHGGGADLIFPHHENEIAQSEAFFGHPYFARYWMHNGLLQLGGEKMSKSLGNIVRLKEIVENGKAMAFRLQVLGSHYRMPLTWTEEGLEAAQNGLDRLRAAASPLPVSPTADRDSELDALVETTEAAFHAAMRNDFDTPVAVASLFELARVINRNRGQDSFNASVETARWKLIELTEILGLDLSTPQGEALNDAAPFIDLLISLRNDLRAARQFDLADKVRDNLAELGVTIEDTRQGTIWKSS
ncbi:MAG: cysteine--tRNA ligase [Thermomicrobiales bacterium]|nr:cysteine--tRNA ligase [Thermomicrobiales bacterium]